MVLLNTKDTGLIIKSQERGVWVLRTHRKRVLTTKPFKGQQQGRLPEPGHKLQTAEAALSGRICMANPLCAVKWGLSHRTVA